MKKLVSLVVVTVLFVSMLTGCIFRYRGDHIDLYTVAGNNVFGADGYRFNGEVSYDPYIEVIEKDNYGRVLFFYDEGYRSKYGTAIVIMQKSEDSFVYYYQDICQIPYVRSEDEYYVELGYNDMFSNEQIESLKEVNNWNKPIDLDKCTKAEIYNRKGDEGPMKISNNEFEKAIKSYVRDHGYSGDDYIYRYSRYCNTDKYGREIYYVYGVGRDANGEGVSTTSESKEYHFAIIFNPDRSCPKENVCEITTDSEFYNTVEQLKENCGWNEPWGA